MPVIFDTTEAPAKKSGVVFEADPITAMADPRNDPAQQLAQKEAVGVRTAARRERERFVRDNADKGVTMDALDRELPATMRAGVSFESNIDKQVDLISKKAGVESAVKSKDGRNVIVRMKDGDKSSVFLLHPKTSTLTAGDIAGATAPLLKTAGAGALAVGTAGMSLPATAAILGGTAAVAEALSSGGSRILAGQPIDPKELALASGKEGAINAALPLAGAGASKVVGKVGGIFRGNAGELEKKLPAAASRLGLETTVAETTGSPALARLGRLTPVEEDARQMALRVAKDRGTVLSGTGGARPLASESQIADDVQPLFARAEQDAAKGVRISMTDAEKAAQTEIKAQLDAGIVPTGLKASEGGAFIRNSVTGNRDLGIKGRAGEFREEAERLFQPVVELAEKEGIVIPTNRISALKDEIDEKAHAALLEFAPGIKKIPALERLLTQEKVTPTGILDVRGKPIVNVEPAPPLTLQQARELRSVVYEMKESGVAPGEGGVPNRYLTKLYKALDDAIDDGVKSGSPELQAAEKKATDYYRTKIQPLQQSDVAKLFLTTDAAGRLGDDEIIRRLVSGKGNLDAMNAYKTVLGETSPEYRLLRRLTLDSIIDESKAAGELVDAGKLLARLNGLTPELRTELLGPVANTITANAKLMSRAQGTKIPLEELEDALLAAPKSVSTILEQAIVREQAYDQTYNGAIQQQLRNGSLSARTMGSADDFLTRFIAGRNTSVADVRQALTQIGTKSPQAVEDIRQRALQNILNTSRANAPLGKTTTREIEDLSHEKLASFLEGTEREKYQAILGQKGIQFLDDLATYAEATAKRQASEQGRRVAGETLAKEVASGAAGFTRNAIGALVDVSGAALRKFGGASAVRNPSVRAFLETGQLPSLSPTARTLILAAPQAEDAREAILAEKP